MSEKVNENEVKTVIKTKRITEFVEGTNIFSSTGISKIKVTDGEEVICLEIPIRSTGISELIDRFDSTAPQPPLVNELVEPGSLVGKQLKLTKKTWVKIPNFGDSEYQKKLQEHHSDLGIAMVLKGLAVQLKDIEGNIITDDNKKIEVLKGMGLSGDQFSKIVKDIADLTKWTEEETINFLG